MAKDMLEKGAIAQRDGKTFAVAPHIPGGIIDVAGLRKIADVAEKYNVQALKLTSAQRIAIVGIKPEDLDNVWADLGMKPGYALGLCSQCQDVSWYYFLQKGPAGCCGNRFETGCKKLRPGIAIKIKNWGLRMLKFLCRTHYKGYRGCRHI
jgi:NAD(P)H-nitrite reductase large subunit